MTIPPLKSSSRTKHKFVVPLLNLSYTRQQYRAHHSGPAVRSRETDHRVRARTITCPCEAVRHGGAIAAIAATLTTSPVAVPIMNRQRTLHCSTGRADYARQPTARRSGRLDRAPSVSALVAGSIAGRRDRLETLQPSATPAQAEETISVAEASQPEQSFGNSGEPRRNRTFNPQIKRRSNTTLSDP